MQPHEAGALFGVFNGEIYNHLSLREAYDISEPARSDTAVILQLFSQVGPKLTDHLDGFFAGVIYDSRAQKLFTIRDALGKKPLYLVRGGASFMLTSELKAAPHVDEYQIVPLGFCEISLETGGITILAAPRVATQSANTHDLFEVMRRAVNKRTACSDIGKFAVFLSGGLDSSIIAAIVESGPCKAGAHYYYLDGSECEDAQYAQELLAFLNVPHSRIRPVKIPGASEMEELISDVVKFTESYNPSIISNGVGTYVLARAVHDEGHKVALGGDGADEVFCGYFEPPKFGPDTDWRASRDRLLADLHRTELRRIDGAAMAHAIEIRCPFLDQDLRDLAEGLTFEDFYCDADNPMPKSVLRRAFCTMLPETIVQRRKQPLDRATGLQRLVVNYCTQVGSSELETLGAIWRGHFGQTLGAFADDSHFHSYPAFDQFIRKRGERYSSAPISP
jgi:asparagine synthase (glutamine-hydrolysing)